MPEKRATRASAKAKAATSPTLPFDASEEPAAPKKRGRPKKGDAA
ncbi:MAG: hypothetical protein U0326_44320 [Polyangiales bacterium]